jgi:hypothetical protein
MLLFLKKILPYYPDHCIPLDKQPFTSVSAATLGKPFLLIQFS